MFKEIYKNQLYSRYFFFLTKLNLVFNIQFDFERGRFKTTLYYVLWNLMKGCIGQVKFMSDILIDLGKAKEV